jgi:hypothetical protein
VTDPKTRKQYKTDFETGATAKCPCSGSVVGDQSDAQSAAELWGFGPKAFKTYYNIRDPQAIQQRADSEIV